MQNTEREQSTTLVPGINVNKRGKCARIVDTIDLTRLDEDMSKKAIPECSVKLTCVVCKEIFTDSIELHKHATLVHSELKIFFCDLCNESFLCEKDMKEHKKVIHHIVVEDNDYLLLQQKDLQKQNIFKHTEKLVNNNLNVYPKRRRRRTGYLKSCVTTNRIQIKTRSIRKNYNNLKSILAKHGCLKKVSIPLTRIDNHPLLQQKISSKMENKSSQIVVKKTYKMDEEEDVFLVKVKKSINNGNLFTISRVDKKVNVKGGSDTLHNVIDTSVLKELIRKLDEQNSANTTVKVDSYENDICSDIRIHCPPTPVEKLGKGFRRTEKSVSKNQLENIQKSSNVDQKETAEVKGHDSEMLESQKHEKQDASNLKNADSPESDATHMQQHPTDAVQDCSTATQKSNKRKSFITSIEIFKPTATSPIITQDTAKHTFNSPGYVPVLQSFPQNPNITITKQYNPPKLGNTTFLPAPVLPEQSSISNKQKSKEKAPIKNFILLKNQDGSIVNIGEANNISTLNLLKQIQPKKVSPVLKEVGVQTNQEEHRMYALIIDYLMSAMKALNPTLMTSEKSVTLSEYRKKNKSRMFVELMKEPSESHIVNQIIGMCSSCRSIATLMKQVSFAKQSIGKSKCPLCAEEFATIVGVKQHLKKTHLPCSIMTGKKHLRINLLNTLETLYVPKTNIPISECFCCKTKFSDIKEFIKHIQLLHHQSIMNILLQSDDETPVFEEEYFITTDKHFENMKYQAKMVSTNSEKAVQTTKNSNVKGRNDHTFCTYGPVAEEAPSLASKTLRTYSLKRSRSVEGPSSGPEEISTKSKDPSSCPEPKEQFNPQNKKLKQLDEAEKSKQPYLCLKCFSAFDSNDDLLKHLETHLVDSLDKSDVKPQEHSYSSTTENPDTLCPPKNIDKSEQNISPTIEKGSKLIEADSTVLINSAQTCPSNSECNEKTENPTADEPVSQNQGESKSLVNVKPEFNFCSSTSHANVETVSEQSLDSMDSSETVHSAQTIVISGNTCKNCNKTFDSPKRLNEHMYFWHDITLGENVIQEIQESPAKENKDSRGNNTVKEENVQTEEGKVPVIRKFWRCFHCGESFNRKEDLMNHRYKEHNDESVVHICENCNTVLTSYSNVNMHLCSNVDSWKCRRCNLDLSNASSLRSHNIQKHLEKEGCKTCPVCNKKFLTMSMLDRHISFIHKKKDDYDNTQDMSEKKDSMSASEPNNAVSSSIHSPMSNNASTSTGHCGSPNIDVKTPQNASNHATVNRVELFDTKKPVAWQCIVEESAFKLFDGDVYTCGVCRRETNSKPGLKLHLKKQHRISAEECQLCTHLFEKECIGKHLIRDHVIPNYSKEDNLERHNYNEESFLKLLSPERLLTCCQYQKYVDHSYHGVDTMRCPRCAKNFLNGRFHRIHFLWMHDTTCLLCNEDFDKPSTAVGHKIKVHNSIGTYMWAVEKILRTLLDLHMFGETIEDMISKLENKEAIIGKGHSNKKAKRKSGKVHVDQETPQASTTPREGEHDTVVPPISKTCANEVSEEVAAQNSAADDSEDDDKRLVLVITQSDIERHKNDIKTLAKNLCAENKIFSQDYIEKLLTSYIESKQV